MQQVLDPNHLVAKQLAADARAPQPVHECCVRNDILWDLAAVDAPATMWTDRLPAAILFNGRVVDVAKKIDAILANPTGMGSVLLPAEPSVPDRQNANKPRQIGG